MNMLNSRSWIERKLGITFEHMQALLIFFFSIPVFFYLTGTIFTSPDFIYDSQGKLLLLPLPIASIFCYVGIAILLRLENRHFGMGVIFSTFMLMIFATQVKSNQMDENELTRFILLVQFILPMFALALGQLYLMPKSDYLRYEAVLLYVLLIIVPLELVATITQQSGWLTPYLYVFSLYQHIEFLPVIFVAFFFIAVNSLYENKILRNLIMFLSPWMGGYIAASQSSMTILLAIIATFVSIWLLMKYVGRRYIVIMVLLLWTSFSIYYSSVGLTMFDGEYNQNSLTMAKEEARKDITETADIAVEKYYEKSLSLSLSISERMPYWRFFGEGIIESMQTFLFGHIKRPDRNKYPSAQNYYLDMIYE